MAIVRWEPIRDMVSLRDAMDKLFEDSFIRPSRLWTGAGELSTDMYQTDNAVVVQATVPGVKAEDIDISLTGDMLTIKGEFKAEQEAKEENYILRERRTGNFQRAIQLPGGLDSSRAEASFEDGILTFTIPKSEEQKPKQIKVQARKTIDEPKKK